MEQNDNRPFWKSATKIVFLMVSTALVAGLFLGKIDPKDFLIVVGQVFAFYFGQKYKATQSQKETTIDIVNSKNK